MASRLELLELGDDVLYFDEPCPPGVAAQIEAAAQQYGQPIAEQRLQGADAALFDDPEDVLRIVQAHLHVFDHSGK